MTPGNRSPTQPTLQGATDAPGGRRGSEQRSAVGASSKERPPRSPSLSQCHRITPKALETARPSRRS
eukprot:3143214-Pyramimonas_sp.AAC.1